jgi:hypothetical protein
MSELELPTLLLLHVRFVEIKLFSSNYAFVLLRCVEIK